MFKKSHPDLIPDLQRILNKSKQLEKINHVSSFVNNIIYKNGKIEDWEEEAGELNRIQKYAHSLSRNLQKEINLEMANLFNENRELFFSSADLVKNVSPNPAFGITCSCGNIENPSCEEDGEGYFSKFYFFDDGKIERKKERKEFPS